MLPDKTQWNAIFHYVLFSKSTTFLPCICWCHVYMKLGKLKTKKTNKSNCNIFFPLFVCFFASNIHQISHTVIFYVQYSIPISRWFFSRIVCTVLLYNFISTQNFLYGLWRQNENWKYLKKKFIEFWLQTSKIWA